MRFHIIFPVTGRRLSIVFPCYLKNSVRAKRVQDFVIFPPFLVNTNVIFGFYIPVLVKKYIMILRSRTQAERLATDEEILLAETRNNPNNITASVANNTDTSNDNNSNQSSNSSLNNNNITAVDSEEAPLEHIVETVTTNGGVFEDTNDDGTPAAPPTTDPDDAVDPNDAEEGQAPNLPDRCTGENGCNGWGHKSKRSHSCPLHSNRGRYEAKMNQLLQQGLIDHIHPYGSKYPENLPPPFITNINGAPKHVLFKNKDWEDLEWVRRNNYKSPDCDLPNKEKAKAHINPELKQHLKLSHKTKPVELYDLYAGKEGDVNITECIQIWTAKYCQKHNYGTATGPYSQNMWKLYHTNASNEYKSPGPSVKQIEALEGLMLFNGCYPHPSLRSYFKGDSLGVIDDIVNCFGGKTGYLIVEQMIKVLRFNDGDRERDQNGEFKNDGLHLCRPILMALLMGCRTIIIGGCKLSLDEIDIGFQGSFNYGKVRIKYKREGDGVLVEAICDAVTGALLTFKFRCDDMKNLPDTIDDLSPLHNRCIYLMDQLHLSGVWREYYCDNLFTTVKFAFYAALRTKSKIGAGIVRDGRFAQEVVDEVGQALPKNSAEHKAKKARQEFSGRSFGLKLHDGVTKFGLIAVCVYDSKPVKIFSSSSDGVSMINKIRKIAEKRDDGTYTGNFVDLAYIRLSLIDEYNFYMGGVDLQDRLRWYYRVNGKHMWRSRKWTWTLYLWVIETRCVNAWIAYKLLVDEDIAEYNGWIDARHELLIEKEATRRLRNGETRRTDGMLRVLARKEIYHSKGLCPTHITHLEFQMSVARSKLGFKQEVERFRKKRVGERGPGKNNNNSTSFSSPAVQKQKEGNEKRRKLMNGKYSSPDSAGSSSKHNQHSYPKKSLPKNARNKGLEKVHPFAKRGVQFHGMNFIRSEGSNYAHNQCQICAIQGPTFKGRLYRNGKKTVPRASYRCLASGCYSNYCSTECFNLYHYNDECPSDLSQYIQSL